MDIASKFSYFDFNNILFFKFWIYEDNPLFENIFTMSSLPGNKEGVSGTSVTGYNIGINKNINTKQKNSAIEFFKYVISKDFQKKSLINKKVISAISTLYEDKEVCEKRNCEFYKSQQFITKPIENIEDFDEYDLKYREYILKFLYGNKTAKETLKNIINIKKFYFLTIHSEDTSIGLICFITITFFIIIILLSLIFLFMKKFSPYFNFLPQDFWIILIVGLLLILSSCYTSFEELTKTKCYLRYALLSFGIILFLIVFLCQLIINFPEENKLVEWTTKHRYQFLLLFILIDIIPKIIIYIITFGIRDIMIINGQNFQICYLKNGFSNFLKMTEYFFMFIITIVICILIYAEWNIKSTFYDLRLILISLYIDILYALLIMIINFVNITNYLIYYMIQDILISLITIFNFLIIFGSKILLGILNKKDIQSMFINKITKKFIESSTTISKTTTYDSNRSNIISTITDNSVVSCDNSDKKRETFIAKIIYFHNLSESENYNTDVNSTMDYQTKN